MFLEEQRDHISSPFLFYTYFGLRLRLRLRLRFRLNGNTSALESRREPKLRLIMLGSVLKPLCLRLFDPILGPIFAISSYVIVRVFFEVNFWTIFFEGSWPAKWRLWPQLSLILSHSKTQKVSSRPGETQVFDLAAFSAAHSSWLLLSSSWGSSWPVFGRQNGPQIEPEVAHEAYQKRGLKMN